MDNKPSLETMVKEANTAMARLKEIEIDEGWVQFGQKPCQMFKMDVNGRMAAKGVVIVNFSFDEVVPFLGEVLTLKKINPGINKMKILYQYTQDIKVNYQEYDGIWPVAGRDVVVLTTKKSASDSKFYIATKSCDFPVAEKNGIVRAEVFIAGYIIEKVDETKTRVTYISDADVKGLIPRMIKNEASKRQGSVASNIEPTMMKEFKK